MRSDTSRWTEITPSQFPWEREALDYVREKLPDHDPYRAFALFEFIASDGSINEVDLLAIGPTGIYLVEIKSWPGVVGGDQRDWVREQEGRRPRYEENPLLLADRKAKRLASLLAQQASVRKAKARIPFIQPLVFLSHPDVVCKLPPFARQHVYLRDESPEGRDREGIGGALTQTEPRRVDRPALQLVLRALNEAGVRPARRKRQVADYLLGELIGEGTGYQDFKAQHVSLEEAARIRIYGLDRERPADEHDAVRRAAKREYELIGGLTHPGFDSPRLDAAPPPPRADRAGSADVRGVRLDLARAPTGARAHARGAQLGAARALDPLLWPPPARPDHRRRVAAFIAAMRRKGLRGSTTLTALRPLSRILAHAARRGAIPINPFTQLERGERPSHDDQRPKRILTLEEMQALIAAADCEQYRCLLELMLASGVRIGEALGLAVGDLDREHALIRVAYQLGRDGSRTPLKTAESQRSIDIPPQLMRRLLALVAARGALFDPTALVFASRNGTGLVRKVTREALKRAVKAAAIATPEPSLHDLRHSHASMLIALDVPVVDVQRRLGHRKPDTTLRVYAHQWKEREARRSQIGTQLGQLFDARKTLPAVAVRETRLALPPASASND